MCKLLIFKCWQTTFLEEHRQNLSLDSIWPVGCQFVTPRVEWHDLYLKKYFSNVWFQATSHFSWPHWKLLMVTTYCLCPPGLNDSTVLHPCIFRWTNLCLLVVSFLIPFPNLWLLFRVLSSFCKVSKHCNLALSISSLEGQNLAQTLN